jgi:nucleoside-diphosphate-sugar epimerase
MQAEQGAGRVVLVTGATGFVGRYLSAELAARGWQVRGLVRGGSLPAGVQAAPAADLLDHEALRRAVRGADAVVHLAARVHVMRESAADPLAEFRRTNVEGTRVLAAEAAAAGVRSFVLASSVKAMGEATEACWTEATPPCPADPYGVSKLEAEVALREVAAAAGMGHVVLRLPLVYGPGVKGNVLRLLRLVNRGVPLPLGGVRNRRSLAYVGNVAAAVHAVLQAPAAGGETFLVSDRHDLSTPELVRLIAKALGRPARLLPVPEGLFRAAGRAGDLLARVAPCPLTSAAVDRLLGSLCVDPSRLAASTGWSPPYTPEQGLREVAAWFRGSTRSGEP